MSNAAEDQTRDDDILLEVTGDGLEEVYSLLEKDTPASLHVLNFIKYYNKQDSSEVVDFKVLCPSGDVKSGIVIGYAVFLNKFSSKFIVIHCNCQKSYELLGEVFLDSPIINWNNLCIVIREERFLPILAEVVRKKDIKVDIKTRTNYVLPLESCSKLRVTLPADVRCRPLTQDDVPLIDQSWAYHSATSHHYVRHCVLIGGGVGLTLGTSGQLVAWAVNKLNSIGFLFTVPQYRRRGYGALVVQLLSQQMISQNIQPCACVNDQNSSSKKLFISLGFQDEGQLHFNNIIS